MLKEMWERWFVHHCWKSQNGGSDPIMILLLIFHEKYVGAPREGFHILFWDRKSQNGGSDPIMILLLICFTIEIQQSGLVIFQDIFFHLVCQLQTPFAVSLFQEVSWTGILSLVL